MKKLGYVAGDLGPRETLEALARHVPGVWLGDGVSDWCAALDAARVAALICGTSDTTTGRALEASARVAAKVARVPCVVIEDYPGNYAEVRDGRPQALIVESEQAARIAAPKASGVAVRVCPLVRYDAQRERLDDLRRRGGASPSRAILWIGQPETADAVETLRVLLPEIAALKRELRFRAHPRDEGYRQGAYAALHGAATGFEDVTDLTLEKCFERRPALIVTQFSSVAVEAGFWGIPALHVLLPQAGGARLAAKKGYARPPWCSAGAAFCATNAAEVGTALREAIDSHEARARVIESFDRYFAVRRTGAPCAARILDEFL